MGGSVKSSPRTPSRSLHCQAIKDLMAPTERTRRKDDVAVMVSADLWKRIYLNARNGAKADKMNERAIRENRTPPV